MEKNNIASISSNLFKSKSHNKNSKAAPRIAAADSSHDVIKSNDGVSRKTVTIAPHHDGYEWRKYGQKQTNGIPFPRCYYRCTYRDEQGCHAKKRVQQQNSDDPPLFAVIYKNEHTCRCNGNTATTSYFQAVDDSTTPRDQSFFLSFGSTATGNEIIAQVVQNQSYVQYSTSSSCAEKPVSSLTGDVSSNDPSTGETKSSSSGMPSNSYFMENTFDNSSSSSSTSVYWGDCLSPNPFGFDQTGYVLVPPVEDSFYSEPDGSETSDQPLLLW